MPTFFEWRIVALLSIVLFSGCETVPQNGAVQGSTTTSQVPNTNGTETFLNQVGDFMDRFSEFVLIGGLGASVASRQAALNGNQNLANAYGLASNLQRDDYIARNTAEKVVERLDEREQPEAPLRTYRGQGLKPLGDTPFSYAFSRIERKSPDDLTPDDLVNKSFEFLPDYEEQIFLGTLVTGHKGEKVRMLVYDPHDWDNPAIEPFVDELPGDYVFVYFAIKADDINAVHLRGKMLVNFRVRPEGITDKGVLVDSYIVNVR